MTKYRSRKGKSLQISLVASIVLPLVITAVGYPEIFKIPFIGFLLFIPAGVLLYLYFGTYYRIEENHIFYQSAFVSGKVNINSINRIAKNKTTLVGLKPATASNGILITYNQHEEIYLSPENKDKFIESLVKINNKISVSGS
jgi:hypothetical protein